MRASRDAASGMPCADGHDVLALDEDAELGALADADVLVLAAADRRILVTFDEATSHRSCGNGPKLANRTTAASSSTGSTTTSSG